MPSSSIIVLVCLKLYAFNILIISSQLIVNVKNKGGEIYKEIIESNTTSDTIQIKYQITDGTMITQLIDVRNEIQIFKAIILPEEEVGHKISETLCFVFRFSKNEFISSDAMSKLRQKNPSAIRHPEEDLAADVLECDVKLDVSFAHQISPHIPLLCHDAPNSTFSKEADLKLVYQILNRNYNLIQPSVHRLPTAPTVCRDQPDLLTDLLTQPDLITGCNCHYNICTGWYPCGLKYCKGKDSTNRVVNYRCGIKTCSKCRRFNYYVEGKTSCPWDFPVFLLEDGLAGAGFSGGKVESVVKETGFSEKKGNIGDDEDNGNE